MNYADYWESEYRVFSLYRIMPDGSCECEKEDCKAVGKHPRAQNWQYTPHWSDEQVETMDEMGQFATGFGVLVDKLLVVDVDARNGGVASYEKLCADLGLDLDAESAFVVTTGSGQGSKHVYFTLPDNMALMAHHDKYAGIDFKSSGYVVGAGSQHKSGGVYESESHPSDAQPAPQALIDALTKVECHRAEFDGGYVDVSDADIASMLESIDPDCDHEKWIRCGMAIHEATGGNGFTLWDNWSAQGSKYPDSDTLHKRWVSFGGGSAMATMGTLVHYAKEAGWEWPIEFTSELGFSLPEDDYVPSGEEIGEYNPNIDISGIDLRRPPGLVGDIVEWINSRSFFARENLAVAGALAAVSNCAGLRYYHKERKTTLNMFIFGVAGSATGKEHILSCVEQLLREVKISAAVVGGIKSEQEIVRNLVEHQAAFYLLDELGEVLAKVAGARKNAGGGASYLEGVIKSLMDIYSKANGYKQVTGDMKMSLRDNLQKEVKRIKDEMDRNESGSMAEQELASALQRLDSVDEGLKYPFLSMFGLTTPEVFDGIMSHEMASNGFVGRALIVREVDNNPKPRYGANVGSEVPFSIMRRLYSLYAGDHSELPRRVELVGERIEIPSTPESDHMMRCVETYFIDMASKVDGAGLEAIPRRATELVNKIALTLAVSAGERTSEHVRWAFAYVRRDIDKKLSVTHGNSASDKGEALKSKIIGILDDDEGVTGGVIRNRCRSYKKETVNECLEVMIKDGHIVAKEIKPQGGGRPTKKYFAVKG